MRELHQRKLDQLVEAFMSDDMLAYRDACEWLRNYVDELHRAKGLQRRGLRWITEAGWRGMSERINNHRRRAHDRTARPHQKIASATNAQA